jgi:hypothetical protein
MTQHAGSRHPTTVETGTWRCDGTQAHVLLTSSNKGPQRNEITFALQEGALVTTKYDRGRYAQGMRLTKE